MVNLFFLLFLFLISPWLLSNFEERVFKSVYSLLDDIKNKFVKINTKVIQKSFVEYSTTCDGQNFEIQCENDQTIAIITAMYGRSNYFTCGDGQDMFCKSTNALAVVRNRCNKYSHCEFTLSAKEMKGDPCPGTTKYLEVSYKCLKPFDRDRYGK